MPEREDPCGLVSRNEIAELAVWFDRSEFALERLSEDCRLAEMEFEDRIHSLFREKVQAHFPGVGFSVFCSKIKSLRRTYLKKNQPA
jgi:hypothetical protein